MTYNDPTLEDFNRLNYVIRQFGQNLIQRYGGDRILDFKDSLPEEEKETLRKAEAMMALHANAEPNDLALDTLTLLFYLKASLPGLKREFGEAALQQELPVEAKSPSVINTCDHIGADDVAQFFRSSINFKPS